MIVKRELERRQKKAVVTTFKVDVICLEGLWKTTKTLSQGSRCPTEIRTGHFPNKSHRPYCFNQIAHFNVTATKFTFFKNLRLPGTGEYKFTVEEAMKAHRGVEVQLYSFFNLGARYGWVVKPRPGSFTPGKDTRYPSYWRLSGPQGRSGRMRKTSPLLGFDPRTVQPVASRYTDYAADEYGGIH